MLLQAISPIFSDNKLKEGSFLISYLDVSELGTLDLADVVNYKY